MERRSTAQGGCVDESSGKESFRACVVSGRVIGHWVWVILYSYILLIMKVNARISALEFEFGYISTYVDVMTTTRTRTIVSLLCCSHHVSSDYRLKGQI
jgi:hypothetical protein